jgi:hypothetical protein
VVDAAKVTPAQAAVRTDAGLRKALAAKDVAWRTYQSDQAEIDALKLRPWLDKGGGLPAVVIQGQDGKVLDVVPVEGRCQRGRRCRRRSGGRCDAQTPHPHRPYRGPADAGHAAPAAGPARCPPSGRRSC